MNILYKEKVYTHHRDFWKDKPADHAKEMLDSWNAPHREQMITAIRLIRTVGTLHEIGCGSGPNLKLLRDKFPKMYVEGSDISPACIELCRKEFNCEEVNLPALPSKSFDAMLSMYTLAYLDREEALAVLDKAKRNGTQNFIIIEPTAYVYPFWAPGVYDNHAMVSYVHDYQELAQETGWRTSWRWPVVPQIMGLNCTLVLAS